MTSITLGRPGQHRGRKGPRPERGVPNQSHVLAVGARPSLGYETIVDQHGVSRPSPDNVLEDFLVNIKAQENSSVVAILSLIDKLRKEEKGSYGEVRSRQEGED